MSVTNTTWVWNNKVTLWVFKGLSNAPLLFWWRSQNQRVTRTTHDLGGSNAIRSDFVPIYYGKLWKWERFPCLSCFPKIWIPYIYYVVTQRIRFFHLEKQKGVWNSWTKLMIEELTHGIILWESLPRPSVLPQLDSVDSSCCLPKNIQKLSWQQRRSCMV